MRPRFRPADLLPSLRRASVGDRSPPPARPSGPSPRRPIFCAARPTACYVSLNGRRHRRPAADQSADVGAAAGLEPGRGAGRHALGRHRRRRPRAALAPRAAGGDGVRRRRRTTSSRSRVGGHARLRRDVTRRPRLRHRGHRAAQPFFDPQEKYIWALAVDASGPALGRRRQSGRDLSRRRRTAPAESIYRPPAAHVVTLARDASGPDARRHRIARTAVPLRPQTIVRSSCSTPGSTELRAAAVGTDRRASSPRRCRAATTRRRRRRDHHRSPSRCRSPRRHPAAARASRRPLRAASRRSVLYRIDPTGTWEPIWETRRSSSTTLPPATTAACWSRRDRKAGSTSVERTREVLLLTGVDAKQITRFAPAARKRAPGVAGVRHRQSGPRRRASAPAMQSTGDATSRPCATRRASRRGD